MQGENKKYEILGILRDRYPEAISGEELSRCYNISRTAVWKYIKTLRAEGYDLEASSKVGYRLVSAADVINGYEIGRELGTVLVGKEVLYLESVDSTSNYAKKIAWEGAPAGLAVVAGSQSGGRGRLGRKWESPPGTGIYLSIILRPAAPPEEVQGITLAASVAVARAIHRVTGIRPGIKWPNDLLLDNKKVCGILTEMNSEMERVNFVVLGIGINFGQKSGEFSNELADKASSLTAYARERGLDFNNTGRLDLIRAVLRETDRVCGLMADGGASGVLEEWREFSVTLGREVRIISGTSEYTAIAEDVTGDGKLMVRLPDGTKRLVQSGEISLRHA